MTLSHCLRVIGVIAALGCGATAVADDTTDSLEEARKLYENGDIAGALREARWAVELLEQQRQAEVTKLFRDEIAGYTGGQLGSQKALGITHTERPYTQDGRTVTVTLTGGSSGAALGGLGALAQLGMGMQQGTKLRIQRRTGVALTEAGVHKIVLTLNSGGVLSFATSTDSPEELREFAEAFPVEALDEALAKNQ